MGFTDKTAFSVAIGLSRWTRNECATLEICFVQEAIFSDCFASFCYWLQLNDWIVNEPYM